MKKKHSLLLLAFAFCISSGNAQLKTSTECPPIFIDLLDGTVNKLHPESPWGEIYTKFPCFSEAIEEPAATGCAGVFLKDKGLNFYTYRDYIEITDKYSGTMNPPIMGTDHNNLLRLFGLPQIKDLAWDAFQTRYGVMVAFFGKEEKP